MARPMNIPTAESIHQKKVLSKYSTVIIYMTLPIAIDTDKYIHPKEQLASAAIVLLSRITEAFSL